MDPQTHNPVPDNLEQPAILNGVPQEHNLPMSRDTKRNQRTGILSIDDRFAILINERVKKEVEQRLASAVKEQLEGLPKPIVDLLHSSISSRLKEADLEQKIVAIVKQQLEALPEKLMAASNAKSANNSKQLLSSSPPVILRSRERTPPAALCQPDSDFLGLASPGFWDGDDDGPLIPRQVMHTNTPSKPSDAQHRTKSKKHALEEDPRLETSKKPKTRDIKEAEWTKSWTDIYVRKQISTARRKNHALLVSTLPAHLQTLILARDLSYPTHRIMSKEMNQKGVPTECCLSQCYPRVDWPRFDGISKGRSTLVVGAQREWWKEWTDISRECAQCEFRREKGEGNVFCFFFVENDTVRLHKEI